MLTFAGLKKGLTSLDEDSDSVTICC